jgi:hypothetical protein
VLNLACVVNLINWSDQPPATAAMAPTAGGPATAAQPAPAATPPG